MTSLFAFIYFLLSGFLTDVVSAGSVRSTDEVIGVNGGNVTLRISFVVESGQHLSFIQLLKSSTKSEIFNTYYIGPQGPSFFDGAFNVNYSSRASTDYSAGKTDFTITLSQLTSDDEGQYKVNVFYEADMESSYTRLVVDFRPSTPSISGAPTEPVLGGAAPIVLQCVANLGKPQASMVWSRRIGSAAYTNITVGTSKITNNSDDGTSSGTSELTVNLDAADNGVQFRCQVSNRQATLSAETGVIEVSAKPAAHSVNRAARKDTTKPTAHSVTRATRKDTNTMKPTGNEEGGDTVKPTDNGEGGGIPTTKSVITATPKDSTQRAAHSVDTATPKDTSTIKPTGNGEGGDTVKPTGNGEGGGAIKPTEKGEGGASAGRDDTPNKIVIGAACVAMAMISTIG